MPFSSTTFENELEINLKANNNFPIINSMEIEVKLWSINHYNKHFHFKIEFEENFVKNRSLL
jgi:hypothetical protein